jgi:lysophospholipase
MPFIPPVETFLEEGLDKRATFFGCDDPSKVTIVWLPHYSFTFASNVSIAQLSYSKDNTNKMIANGVQVANQGVKRDGERVWVAGS